MSYKTVGTYVEVEVDLSEWDTEELIEELRARKAEYDTEGSLNREDWQFLLEMIDKQPVHWYTRRVREKLLEACYG
jgi:hypothetical protein